MVKVRGDTMIPDSYIMTSTVKDMPSKTYKIDWENNSISGFIDGIDAIAQSVELAVSTERYIWDIYSWNYGSELHTLIGKSDGYAMSEMKRMIHDALLPDTRVKDTYDFVFKPTKDGIECSFTVSTIAGDVNATV